MQFGFPRDRQLRYADFARLRPAQKRGRAFMYLKLATLYTKYFSPLVISLNTSKPVLSCSKSS